MLPGYLLYCFPSREAYYLAPSLLVIRPSIGHVHPSSNPSSVYLIPEHVGYTLEIYSLQGFYFFVSPSHTTRTLSYLKLKGCEVS